MDILWVSPATLLEWLVPKRGVQTTLKLFFPGRVLFYKDNLCHVMEDHNIIYVYIIPLGERYIYLIFYDVLEILILYVKRICTRTFD